MLSYRCWTYYNGRSGVFTIYLKVFVLVTTFKYLWIYFFIFLIMNDNLPPWTTDWDLEFRDEELPVNDFTDIGDDSDLFDNE